LSEKLPATPQASPTKSPLPPLPVVAEVPESQQYKITIPPFHDKEATEETSEHDIENTTLGNLEEDEFGDFEAFNKIAEPTLMVDNEFIDDSKASIVGSQNDEFGNFAEFMTCKDPSSDDDIKIINPEHVDNESETLPMQEETQNEEKDVCNKPCIGVDSMDIVYEIGEELKSCSIEDISNEYSEEILNKDRNNESVKESENLEYYSITESVDPHEIKSKSIDSKPIEKSESAKSDHPDEDIEMIQDDFGDFADFNSIKTDNASSSEPLKSDASNDGLTVEGHSEENDDFGDFANFQEANNSFGAFEVEESSNNTKDELSEDVVMSCYLPTTTQGKTTGGSVTPEENFEGFTNKIETEKDAIGKENDENITDSKNESPLSIDKDFEIETPNDEIESPGEFNEFASAKIDDAFGEEGDDFDDEDDDFGDFSGPAGQVDETISTEETKGVFRGISVDSSCKESEDDSADPLLRKVI